MATSTTVRAVIAGTAVLAVGLGTTGANAADPDPFVNGGFETPIAPDGAFTTFAAPSGFDGWQVVSGSVDLLRGTWPVHGGSQSVDLSGEGPGSISQTFDTIAGHTYDLSYWVNSNQDGPDGTGDDWSVSITSGAETLASGNGHWTGDDTSAANTKAGPDGWEKWGPTAVLATGPSMTITLTSLEDNPYGVIIDDVAGTMNNRNPVVGDQPASTDEDTTSAPITLGPATDADGDAVTYTVSDPPHGTATVVNGNQATYTPDSNYNGPDTFTATGSDDFGGSDSGLVSVTVAAVQDASTLLNTKPSQGIWTNKKSTVVMQALVASTDPACVAGRTVTFTVTGGNLTAPLTATGPASSTGQASGKFVLPEGSYTVVSSVAESTACGAATDSDPYVFTQPKR